MAKSWLDVQVDIELSQPQQGRVEGKQLGDDVNGSTVESWPYHVFDQQPRDLPALLQKLHSRFYATMPSHCNLHLLSDLFIFL